MIQCGVIACLFLLSAFGTCFLCKLYSPKQNERTDMQLIGTYKIQLKYSIKNQKYKLHIATIVVIRVYMLTHWGRVTHLSVGNLP